MTAIDCGGHGFAVDGDLDDGAVGHMGGGAGDGGGRVGLGGGWPGNGGGGRGSWVSGLFHLDAVRSSQRGA
ncbi:hypothetical protein EII18_12975, partial [Comamonadaceae bacterium OH3737_COT-264]